MWLNLLENKLQLTARTKQGAGVTSSGTRKGRELALRESGTGKKQMIPTMSSSQRKMETLSL